MIWEGDEIHLLDGEWVCDACARQLMGFEDYY
jgi:hypothetical protein